MQKFKVKAHTVKPNGYFTNKATRVEFEGKLLVEHRGFRGREAVYQTKKGQLAIVYDNYGYSEKIFRKHPDLADIAKFTEGYTKKEYPDYNQGMINKIAEALGEELPAKNGTFDE